MQKPESRKAGRIEEKLSSVMDSIRIRHLPHADPNITCLPSYMCKPAKRNVADRNISTTEACITFSVSVGRISETSLSSI